MTAAVTVRANGKAEMAYTGEAPWHSLGHRLEEGRPMSEWVEAAGFDFEIKAATVQYQTEDGKLHSFRGDKRRVLYRADNNYALGVLSDMYQIVQPGKILEYFERLSEKAGFKLSTAGTLFGGSRYWGLAKVGKPQYILDPADQVQSFLLFATSADGSLPSIVKFGNERVVCNNTLTGFLSEKGHEARFSHLTELTNDKIDREMGIQLLQESEHIATTFQRLGGVKMNEAEMVKATIRAIAPKEAKATELDMEAVNKLLKKRSIKRINTLALTHENIIGGEFLPKQTALSWLNCVTQVGDHASGSRMPDHAAWRSLFGSISQIKNRAYQAVASVEGDLMKTPQLNKNIRDPALVAAAHAAMLEKETADAE